MTNKRAVAGGIVDLDTGAPAGESVGLGDSGESDGDCGSDMGQACPEQLKGVNA